MDIRDTTLPGLILFGSPLALGILRAIRGRDRTLPDYFWALGVLSFLPPLVAFAASHLLPFSIFGRRYLIICAVPYLLLVSSALYALPQTRLRAVVVFLIVLWGVSAGVYGLSQSNWGVKWGTMVRKILTSGMEHPDPKRLYTFEEYVTSPLRYYLRAWHLTEKVDQEGSTPQLICVVRSSGWHTELGTKIGDHNRLLSLR